MEVTLDLSVMDGLERIGFLLRGLYQTHGFQRYRMSKFEEYDLYSGNKEFLLSDRVITFPDANGRLMALKPDVTLSIVRNTRDGGDGLQKLYYHENVYRVPAGEDGFREETQVGVECMGPVEDQSILEMILLAGESLSLLSRNYILEVSHLDLLSGFLDEATRDPSLRGRILQCVTAKNAHGVRTLFREAGLSEIPEEKLLRLMALYGPPDEVLPGLSELTEGTPLARAASQLRGLTGSIPDDMRRHVWIDFSAAGDLKYYNGIAFKGFLQGVPDPVLSGGQYDALMRRMRRRDRAIGFAVFLHRLDRFAQEGGK